MTVLRLRGVVLPDDEERDVYVDGDRLTFDPVGNADTILDGGWLVPGLVDVHTHPGAEKAGDPFDEELLRQHGERHRNAGVLTLRVPGSVERLPEWFGEAEDLPRVQSAGPWIAVEGRFFRGWGRQVPLSDVVASAVDEARANGQWAKVVLDWSEGRGDDQRYTPAVDIDTLREVVRRVHAIGAKVAVHSQHPDTAIAAVEVGVDSLEHGMHLPFDLVDTMREKGIALTPTLLVMSDIPDGLVRRQRPPEMHRLLETGWERLPKLTAAAYEAGVTVLAGTDLPRFGVIEEEVRWLAQAGMPSEAALGAASWVARSWLGLPLIEDGGLADIVAYDRDPRTDLTALAEPTRIVLRGKVVK